MNDQAKQNNLAMIEAGISNDCRSPEVKLRHLGQPGVELAGWLQQQAPKDIATGRGVAVVGPDDKAYRAFQLLARGVLLGLHQNVQMIALPYLYDATVSGKAFEFFSNVDCIFVEGFFTDHYGKGSQPYTPERIDRLEWFMQWAMKRGILLFLLTTTRIVDCTWYSPMFLRRLMACTKEVIVK